MSLPKTNRVLPVTDHPNVCVLTFPLCLCGYLSMQVAESSPAKQFLFKRSLQTAQRRRMLVEAEKPIGRALDLQHRLLDKVILGV